ncbi:MAG: START-like domain-containing protein [Flavobacteriales bacterium]
MIKYSIEYPLKSSVKVLYNNLGTASGLGEWFADEVVLKGKNIVFTWDGYPQEAEVLSKKSNSHIRFSWVDEEDYPYFEFRIVVDEITNDVSLFVTDFVEDEDEMEDAKLLWNKQIDKLKASIGS